TGRPPFPGGTPVEKVARHLSEDVPALDADRLGLPAGPGRGGGPPTAPGPPKRHPTARRGPPAPRPLALPAGQPPEAGSAAVAPEPAVARDVAPSQGPMVAPNLPSGPFDQGPVPWRWAAALALFFFFGVVASAGGGLLPHPDRQGGAGHRGRQGCGG